MAPQTVEEYVEWVLKDDASLASVDPEVKTQLVADYVQALEDEITAALIAAVPEAKLPELEELLDAQPGEAVQQWIEQQVPNSGDVIAGVLVRFRTNYLSADDVR